MVNFVAKYSIYVITLLFMIICSFLTDKFLTASNLVNILRQVTVYAVLAFGLFLLFYPVLSGQPVDVDFVVKYLRWRDTWVLISG